MALQVESALDRIETILDDLANVKTSTRDLYLDFDKIPPDGYPYSVIGNIVESQGEQGIAGHTQSIYRVKVSIATRFTTGTQIETFRKAVKKVLIEDALLRSFCVPQSRGSETRIISTEFQIVQFDLELFIGNEDLT